ncbi:MAG: N-6 DNA methylase [Saprospiraceae bacterium]|nr:N-6 DNA methylase [Saprospiraceae bacterium]
MTITEIRQLLESPYNQKEWKVFLQSHFTNGKLFGDAHSIELMDKTISKKCYSLGNYEVNEYTKIGIFEVQLNDNVKLTRNRVGLRNLIKSITQQVAGAMVVFVQGDKWRFSYISKRKVKNKETDTIEDKETAPKRYTYLFGKNEKALTAAIRFDKLIQKQQGNIFQFLTLNDFEEAFSVEKLSKDFFNEYKKSYEDFVEFITGKRYVKKGNKFVETVIHPANFQLRNLFGNDEKQARDFCKRMMGRIVFLYFIQKKGWLAVGQGKKWGEGNQDYLFDLFKNSKHKDDFYSQELVPLFFKTLNNTASEKETNTLRFPYLNGGLFDDSHDRKFNKLAMPTEIFENLFNTFNNFNFTIYEDAPDEHTVAVDPEMLGHIFENLLEDNKDKGAFYTPKEIVHYMCRESLKEYLIASDELNIADNQTGKETINKIIQQQELSKEEIVFAEKNAFKIIDALEQVKICDPAIGSGAFPMGLLQEIFNAQIYLQELKGFKKGTTDAQIKKHIIEESIYGVDIDAGAVDIARLRFWLSLVVEETEPQPLPNLSFKIVCANTLIPLGKIKNLDMGGTKEIADGLAQVRHDYFNASMEEKTALETKFTSLQKKLLTTAKEWVSKDDAAVYQRLLEFSPFEDTSCTWFDAWWMFGVNDGFDIVIGNPPYGAKLSADDKKLYYSIYKHQDYQLDTYLLFIEKSFQMMKPNAVNAFIIPNTWLINLKLEKFRKYIVDHNTILNIVHYHKSVFENAVVDTQVVIFKKQISNNNLVQILEYIDIEKPSITTINQDKWKNLNGEPINIFINESSQAIIDVIKQNDNPLSSICNVVIGMKPYQVGKGKPKQTKEVVDERIFDAVEKLDDTYRELLRGKDINKYVTLWDGKRWIQYGDFLAEPRYSANFDLPEKIVIRQTSDRLIATLDTKKFVCMNNLHIVNPKDKNYNLKYVLAIINSRLMDFYYETLNPEKGEALAEVKKENVEKLLIKLLEPAKQTPFVNLVDYLLFLNDKNSEQLFTHTTNERIAAHVEDVLNMMVYELYFEKHMRDVGIDVLQFINPKQIGNLIAGNEKAEEIKKFYLWLQTPDNQVRQRINIVDIKSPNIISKINLATQ